MERRRERARGCGKSSEADGERKNRFEKVLKKERMIQLHITFTPDKCNRFPLT